ncbi:MAG: phosphotransferase, partial [Longimicrobiales bacterium]
ECLGDVADAGTRARIEHFLPLLDARAPLFDTLRTSVIHGDANDHNVLVVTADGRVPAVSGIIDFGDVVRSWTIGELAIGCAYAMLGEPDPLAAAAEVVAGHHEVAPIPEHELEALFPLICTRLCVSAVLAAHQRAAHPDNDYLSISEAPVRALLGRLIEVDAADDHERLLAAAPP